MSFSNRKSFDERLTRVDLVIEKTNHIFKHNFSEFATKVFLNNEDFSDNFLKKEILLKLLFFESNIL